MNYEKIGPYVRRWEIRNHAHGDKLVDNHHLLFIDSYDETRGGWYGELFKICLSKPKARRYLKKYLKSLSQQKEA